MTEDMKTFICKVHGSEKYTRSVVAYDSKQAAEKFTKDINDDTVFINRDEIVVTVEGSGELTFYDVERVAVIYDYIAREIA